MSYEQYISRLENESVSDALSSRLGLISRVLERVEEENKWNYRYAENKWTAKQIVQHLIDCERIFSFRAMHIVRKDDNPLFLFDENEYAKEANVTLKSQYDLFKEYECLITATYLMYKNFDENELKRSAAVVGNTINVETMGRIIAGHSLHHMDILEERYLGQKVK